MKRSRTMMAVWKQLVQTEDDSCSPRRSKRFWLWNWMWSLIKKIQGHCYWSRGSSRTNSTLYNTWCLTEQTNVPRPDTTNNRINRIAWQIWPTMLHVNCAFTNSSALKSSKYFNKLLGPLDEQRCVRVPGGAHLPAPHICKTHLSAPQCTSSLIQILGCREVRTSQHLLDLVIYWSHS